ncbi:MAG: hypothetical protein ACOZCL_06620 [Bacillota bacterium]
MKESELVSVMNRHLKDNGLLYANEIRMGIGIPDIMVGCHVPEEHENIMDYYALKLYYLIVDNNIKSISEAAEKSVLTKNHLLRCIRILADSKIIKVIDERITVTKRIDDNNLGVNVSIEVKIKDWKGGLVQAQRYLCFSDYSYVALPENTVKSVDIDKFTESGIGLLGVADDCIYEVIKPFKSTECDHLFKYISISTMLEKNEDIVISSNSDDRIFSVI